MFLMQEGAVAHWMEKIEKPTRENLKRVGSENWDEFISQGVSIANTVYQELSNNLDGSLQNKKILDFGCGIGRVLLPMVFEKGIPVSGCDIDDTAITYLRRISPNLDISTSKFSPPLKFPDGHFDAVYSISIWTHLNLDMQLEWLAEMQRILKPGGVALLSVAGHNSLRIRHRRGWPLWKDVTAEDLTRQGVIYKEYPWLEPNSDKFPGVEASYGGAMHDADYIRKAWADYFDVLDVKSGHIHKSQDLVILKRQGGAI